MNPCQTTVFITTVANIIAKDKSENEINILSTMLVQLGDTLATISLLKEDEKE